MVALAADTVGPADAGWTDQSVPLVDTVVGGGRSRWRVPGIAALVVVVLTGGAVYFAIKHSTTAATGTTTAAPPAPAVTVATMDALLLSDAEINTATGTAAMAVSAAVTTLGDNSVSPPECLPVAGALQARVYAGSGWMAAHGQAFQEPSGQYPHAFDGIVLFPSAQTAAAFFTASSKSWPACSNRGYSFPDAGANVQRTVGPVSIADGTISATNVTEGGNGLACQHALTANSNVVIETLFCGYNTADQAVRIAHELAAKVPRS